MGRMKIFSGNSKLAEALKLKIEEVGIEVTSKDNPQAARLAKSGTAEVVMELFIDESQYGKVFSVIEEFRMNI